MNQEAIDNALERAISALAEYQAALENDARAYNVSTMVALLKRGRRPEVVARLEAERLQRARAA